MKKNVVLGLVVLALIASPLLADPVFSGSFTYGFTFEKKSNLWEDTSNSAKLDFGAKISDYTSLNAVVSADEGDPLEVGTMVFSQDLTGALGIEGAVAISYKLGAQSYTPANYGIYKEPSAEVGVEVGDKTDTRDVPSAGGTYEETFVVVHPDGANRGSDSTEIGLITTLKFAELVNVDLAFYPTTYLNEIDDDEEFAVNLYGNFGPSNLSVYYTVSDTFAQVDSDGDLIDGNGDFLGFNADVGFGDVLVSVNFERDMDAETQWFALAGKYTMGGLTAKLGYDVGGIGKDDFDFVDGSDVDVDLAYAIDAFNIALDLNGSLDDFAAKSNVAVKMDYTMAAAKFFAKVKMGKFKDFKSEDDLTYDLGLTYTVDTMAFSLGYTNGSDSQDIIDDDHEKGIFAVVQASF